MNTTLHILQELTGRGLRQADIRRMTGIPQARISKWLAGHVPRAADDSLRLLRLLEQTPERKAHLEPEGAIASIAAEPVMAPERRESPQPEATN